MSSAFHDDDDSARRRRPPAGPGAAVPPTSAKPAALTWGIIGTTNRIEPLTVVPGITGIVRLVSNDVRYTRPPTEAAWSEIASEPGRFEMVWPADPKQARTLAAIADDARQAAQANGPLPPGHPTAVALDEAVSALVLTADRLQARGWGIGPLTPESVLVARTEAGLIAVPVDLGFSWIGEYGEPPWDASPGRPDWLEPGSGDNPASLVWERPPAEQQFAQPTGGLFTPSPEHDLRTLARVIAWALTGRPSRKLDPSRAAIWSVLQEMLDGRYASPGELLPRLKESPPSGQFAAEPKSIVILDEEKAGSSVVIAGGVVILLAVLGAAAFFLLRDPGTTPTPGTETASTSPSTEVTPGTTSTTEPGLMPNPGSLEAEYAAIPAGGVLARIAKFRELAMAAASDPELQQRITPLRAKLFADWIAASEQHATDPDPARRAEAGSALRKLVDAYNGLHETSPPSDPALRSEEHAWLEQYDRQAALLGWPR